MPLDTRLVFIVKDFGKALLKTKSSSIFFSYKLSERKPLFEIAQWMDIHQTQPVDYLGSAVNYFSIVLHYIKQIICFALKVSILLLTLVYTRHSCLSFYMFQDQNVTDFLIPSDRRTICWHFHENRGNFIWLICKIFLESRQIIWHIQKWHSSTFDPLVTPCSFWGPLFQISYDADVTSAFSYVKTCLRVRNSKNKNKNKTKQNKIKQKQKQNNNYTPLPFSRFNPLFLNSTK